MKPVYIVTYFYLFICLFSKTAVSAPLLIPEPKLYKDFLLEPWKNNKPVLIAFKDPFCPYCIKDLKKRKQLSQYNVFLFWAAILGERSISRVNDFFNCDSPSGGPVLEAVIEKANPSCNGSYKEKLFKLNKEMVANYKPNAVPQYWLGGRQVSLRRLKLDRNIIDANSIASSSTIKINWLRYKYNAINEPVVSRFSVAVILPAEYKLSKKDMHRLAIDNKYNWYVFGGKNNQNQLWCRRHVIQCSRLQPRQRSYKKNSAEIKLLIGMDEIDRPVISFEGKLLIKKEKKNLFSRDIWHIFKL